MTTENPMAIIDTVWEPQASPPPPPSLKSSTRPNDSHRRIPHPLIHAESFIHSIHTHLPWHSPSHEHHTPPICPETDIRETASAYHIEMALAGVSNKDSVLIRWREPRTLIVQGGLTKPEAQIDREQATFVRPPVEENFGGMLKKISVSGSASKNDREELVKVQNGASRNGDGGEVHFQKNGESGPLFILKERRLGLFQRTFTLPVDVDVDIEGCKARLEHGLLRIDIPKKETQDKQERKLTLEDT